MKNVLMILLCGCSTCPKVKSLLPLDMDWKLCLPPDLVVTLNSDHNLNVLVKRATHRWNQLAKPGPELFVYAQASAVDVTDIPRGFIYVRYATYMELENWKPTTKGKFRWKLDRSRQCLLGGLVLLRPSVYTDDAKYLEMIIMHELGHALGLNHVYTSYNIMSVRLAEDLAYKGLVTLSEESAERIKEVYSTLE